MALTLSGCCLFAARPAPLPRPAHVIIVGVDGLKRTDIDRARTPHLYLMQQDGAYTWDLPAKGDRMSTYCEVLTGLPRSLHAAKGDLAERSVFARCRRVGWRAASVVRSPGLAAFDRSAIRLTEGSRSLDHPVAAGSYAASWFLAKRPACLFVELSAGADRVEDCDAGLGKIFAAIQRGGLAEQTTVILTSARSPKICWMVRGPGTRHGHRLTGRISAADTLATVAWLLGFSVPGVPSRRVTGAFRTSSGEPDTKGERTVPRGSVRGSVVRADGRPMNQPSVLLVKTEPVDGIHERWADASSHGEFWFEGIPACTYDYVFIFDNLPGRLRRSLLVKRDFEVKRDAPNNPVFTYRRLREPKASAPVTPAAESAASFLDRRQIDRLTRAGKIALPTWEPTFRRVDPPLLAADALSGRRVRTSLIREWLRSRMKALQSRLSKGAIDRAAVDQVLDFAAAYDLNRASGLLTDGEELDVRELLADAAGRLHHAYDRKKLPAGTNVYTALALISGALRPSPASDEWLEKADTMFERRLGVVAEEAERDPCGIDHKELCSILEYAMVNRAMGCGNYIDDELERLVDLAAQCLTPSDRRLGPPGNAGPPRKELGFLGLARSAFRDDELGGRTGALWEMCGRPFWAPRDDESLLGALLTAAGPPKPGRLPQRASRKLTKTTALLTRDWGTPGEWLVRVSGWTVDLHVGGAPLAKASTALPGAGVASVPSIVRFKSSPAYDYVLLRGTLSGGAQDDLAAYRHILFNKLTGYLVVSDELPLGRYSTTRIRTAQPPRRGILQGAGGRHAQLLALAATAAYAPQIQTLFLNSASRRPSFAVHPLAPGVTTGTAVLRPWIPSLGSLADSTGPEYGDTHLILKTNRGEEFVRLARSADHAEDNSGDVLLKGAVAVIRRGPKSSDLMLIDAARAQCGDCRFQLERGAGYVTIDQAGRAAGWSEGRSRDVTVVLGAARRSATLRVDGRERKLTLNEDRADFYLPSGAHTFVIGR